MHETAELQLKRTWQQFTIGGGGNEMKYFPLEVQSTKQRIVFRMIHGARIPNPTKGLPPSGPNGLPGFCLRDVQGHPC